MKTLDFYKKNYKVFYQDKDWTLLRGTISTFPDYEVAVHSCGEIVTNWLKKEYRWVKCINCDEYISHHLRFILKLYYSDL